MNMKMNKNSKLNNFQKKFILENYKFMPNDEIAKNINIEDTRLIRSYAKNCHLTKNLEAKKVKHGIYKKITNKDHSYIYKSLLKSKEPKLKKCELYKSKYGKYFVNQNYFNKIDNEWKAYWFGFLCADGTNAIRKKNNKTTYTIKLCLSIVDLNHLCKFKKSLQSDAPIKERLVKNNDKIFKECDINICNQQICNDLNKYGCVPKKSLILKFPNKDIISDELIRHFIRGYFDGDGCVHINKKNKSTVINFTGTEDFLDSLRQILHNKINMPILRITRKKGQKAYQLSYGGIEEFEKIFEFLYKDANIFLDRKLEKFKTIL